jgi:hypothetical protein
MRALKSSGAGTDGGVCCLCQREGGGEYPIGQRAEGRTGTRVALWRLSLWTMQEEFEVKAELCCRSTELVGGDCGGGGGGGGLASRREVLRCYAK